MNVPFICGVGYITFMVGMAVAKVGEVPKGNDPFGWMVVVAIFCVTAVPFACGFIAGKEESHDQA